MGETALYLRTGMWLWHDLQSTWSTLDLPGSPWPCLYCLSVQPGQSPRKEALSIWSRSMHMQAQPLGSTDGWEWSWAALSTGHYFQNLCLGRVWTWCWGQVLRQASSHAGCLTVLTWGWHLFSCQKSHAWQGDSKNIMHLGAGWGADKLDTYVSCLFFKEIFFLCNVLNRW